MRQRGRRSAAVSNFVSSTATARISERCKTPVFKELITAVDTRAFGRKRHAVVSELRAKHVAIQADRS